MTAVRWLAALPFLGILIGTAFVNQVEPLVFGMPFVLAWIVGWVVIGAAAMAIIYALDPPTPSAADDADGDAPMNAALVIIGLVDARRAGARRSPRAAAYDMTLEQWTVGGRGFGGLLVFLLMAGEIYTTFTFLGGSGWAYGTRRAGLLHPLLRLARVCPLVLAAAADLALRQAASGCMSQPHFFARKYDSPGLGVLVAAVGVVALVPYLVLQFKGLGIIVSVASYGAISLDAGDLDRRATVTIYVIDLRRARRRRGTPR